MLDSQLREIGCTGFDPSKGNWGASYYPYISEIDFLKEIKPKL